MSSYNHFTTKKVRGKRGVYYQIAEGKLSIGEHALAISSLKENVRGHKIFH
jgi:hypothetical protein